MPRPPTRSRRPFIHFSLLSLAAASLTLCALPWVVGAQPAETEQWQPLGIFAMMKPRSTK